MKQWIKLQNDVKINKIIDKKNILIKFGMSGR